MEVRIGVQNVAREITFESAQSAEEVQEAVASALSLGQPVSLTDDKGRVVLVPADAVGYVHIGEQSKGRFGFGTA